eukprot:m.310427 g.310427  ORF g.310427 m.310427 type:complete len:336 (+) comp51604_c0_seq1:47-1054(+)
MLFSLPLLTLAMASRSSWRQISEPGFKKPMFVNTETGECSWRTPDGQQIAESQATDWWEFVDTKSSRHYYYNQETGKKRWKRPKRGEVVFMGKVQDPSFTANSMPQSKPKPKTKPAAPPKPVPYSGAKQSAPEVTVVVSAPPVPAPSTAMDSDAPIWLDDSKYDLCLVQSNESAFADELASYFDQFAVRYIRHTPSSLGALRSRYEDYNDEEDTDPALSALTADLKETKFFMFVFGKYFVDTPSEFREKDSAATMKHFSPEDPIHFSMELVNLLPILDGPTQEDLKKYSPTIGSKIPIKASIGSKRLAEMFFKKLTGQMPNENFKLQKYLKTKKK